MSKDIILARELFQFYVIKTKNHPKVQSEQTAKLQKKPHVISCKRGKTRVRVRREVSVLQPIAWKDGASFLYQQLSAAKQNQ